MREFLQCQRDMLKYDEFLRRKVERACESRRAGLGRSNADVEVDFAVKRAALVLEEDATDSADS